MHISKDRKLVFEKFEQNIDIKKFLKSPARRVTQAHWEGAYVFKGHRRIVAAADSSLATTIPIPLTLERESGMHALRITVSELEEGISQAMTKILPQCRAEAAKRFGVEEIGVVLVGAKAKHFAIDGKSTEHPVGFVGGAVSLTLELTLVERDLFDDFRAFFSSPEPFSLFESAQARLAAIARIKGLPLNLISVTAAGSAQVYVLEAAKGTHPVLYREGFPWSFGPVLRAIRDEFGVSEKVAAEMYEQYISGGVSPRAARMLDTLVSPSLETFAKRVVAAKLHGATFLDAPYDFPPGLVQQVGKATFEEMPIQRILETFGFTADLDSFPGRKNVPWRHLAPFLEMYFERGASSLNEKIRRRLHWLTH